MTKDHIFREARKLVDILNKFGNCIVPSIHKNGKDTSAKERLAWILKEANNKYGLQIDDVQAGIDEL